MEVVTKVNTIISKLGLIETHSALLCMLGESVAIVPKNYQEDDEWVPLFSSELEKIGFSSFQSGISPLM